MFRFIPISILMVLLDQFDFFRNAYVNIVDICIDAVQHYSGGFLSTIGFIAVPFVISVIIDWKLIYRMFLSPKQRNEEFRWEAFVVLNWVFSGVFTITMTHILSHGGLKNIRKHMVTNGNTYEFKLALVLAFLSLTYLIGFFGVSLAAHDVSSTSSRQRSSNPGLTSFVPPIYYLGVVAIVWQMDTSLLVRTCVCGSSMIFFAALHLSRFVQTSTIQNTQTSHSRHETLPDHLVETIQKSGDRLEHSKQTPSSCGDAINKHEIVDTGSGGRYTHFALANNLNALWWRQLTYDLFVYALPLVIVGIFIPSIRLAVHGMVYLLTCIVPLYEYFATKLYFQPSDPESPTVSADRLTSYPESGSYVNGWFRLADSSDLPIGSVKYINAMGRHFALFRGQDSVVRCLDAHCIHLGANLAVGGKVVNNCLECPFHKWRFDGDGQCTHIPYQSQIPQQAQTRAYHVTEYYGIILVWYHSHDAQPAYSPPKLPKFDNGDMFPRGKRETIVNMHINEFAENSTDFMHFDPLHGCMHLPFTPLTVPGLTVNHQPGWKQGTGEESHISWFLDNADLSFCGVKIPNTAASAVITIVGPAGIVFFTFATPIGTIILFQTHTPLEPLRLHTTFRYLAMQ